MTFELFGVVLELGAPRSLWLLATAPLWMVPLWLSTIDRPRKVKLAHLLLRLGVLTALSTALARPALRSGEGRVAVTVLADVSASRSDAALVDARRTVEALWRTTRAGTEPVPFTLLRFAGAVEAIAHDAHPREPPKLSRFDGEASAETDLAQALGLALGQMPPEHVQRFLLLSDGRLTRGDLHPAVERAAAAGVRLFFHAPAERPARDIAVIDLSAPDEIDPGAPFAMTARIFATQPERLTVRLFRNGRPSAPDAERAVSVGAGETRVGIDARIETDSPAHFELVLASDVPDAAPENDRAQLLIMPRQRPRVLIVEGQAFAGAPLAQALASQQFAPVTVPARRFPDRAGLEAFDLVVVADVPRAALTDQATRALEAYLKDGGGLLMAMGPYAAASTGYEGTLLDALLPLRQEQTAEQHEPTLALSLVIDRSGSMSGPKMELTKEAARGTAETMAPEDLISVIVFDSQAHTVVRLQAASNRQRILGDIAQIRASGGTNLLPALREAIEPLLAVQAKKKHVIVLSDGQSPAEGISELVDEAVAARITVSAVGVGEGADLGLLQTIATRGGGRFYQTRDPESIPRIFSRETAQFTRPAQDESPTHLRVTRRSDVFAGIRIENAPPLRGRAKARAKQGAEVLLSASDGAPLLARWQIGLGQSLVWASALSGRWAADLARWSAYPKLWAQVSRSAIRRGADGELALTVRREGARLVVEGRAVGSDESHAAPGGLLGAVELANAPPSAPAAVRLVQSAALREIAPGRYTATMEDVRRTPLLLRATLNAPGVRRPTFEGSTRWAGLARPEWMPPELGPARPAAGAPLDGRALLETIAARTGGGAFSTVEALVSAGTDRAGRRRSVRTEVALFALLIFLVDVALRRATLRASKAAGRGAAW